MNDVFRQWTTTRLSLLHAFYFLATVAQSHHIFASSTTADVLVAYNWCGFTMSTTAEQKFSTTSLALQSTVAVFSYYIYLLQSFLLPILC